MATCMGKQRLAHMHTLTAGGCRRHQERVLCQPDDEDDSCALCREQAMGRVVFLLYTPLLKGTSYIEYSTVQYSRGTLS